MVLPESYIVQKFYQYAGQPKYNTLAKTYQGSCPVCREGKSWGKKRRLFYIVNDGYFHCHNCGGHWSPINWVKEVSGLSVREIYKEADEYDVLPNDLTSEPISTVIQKIYSRSLPEDSINLFDTNQIEYYKSNSIINSCLNYIKQRKLDTAINRPSSLYVSLKDHIHKNRLIIPFYDTSNKIIFYQTRTVIESNTNLPKYLGKVGGDKSVFNIDKVSENFNQIFVLEGPIDAFFIENGVAIAGIHENQGGNLFTSLQTKQLRQFPLHEKIFVLDSQWIDTASLNTSKILLEKGYKIFIWPKKFGVKFKDLNDMCVKLNINKAPVDFILKNTYKSLQGLVKLSQIKC